MTIDGVKVKKIKVLQDGQEYQCKKGLLTTGEIVFKSGFNVTVKCYDIFNDVGNSAYFAKVVVEPFESDEPIHVKIYSQQDIFSYPPYDGERLQLDQDVTKEGITCEWDTQWGGAGGSFDGGTFKKLELTYKGVTQTLTSSRSYTEASSSGYHLYLEKTFVCES